MDYDLAGRRVLVTGSTDGVGRALSALFADEGCAVLIHGRDTAKLDDCATELHSHGVHVDTVAGDLSDRRQVDTVCRHATAFGVDVLVNNAGPFSERSWEQSDPWQWQPTFDTNVIAAVALTQAVLPHMRVQQWGRIINLGSRATSRALPTMIDYSAAKAAIVNLTTSLARHLDGTGITANCISPGIILTPSLQEMLDEHQPLTPANEMSIARELGNRHAPAPAGRLGLPTDIANAAAYLASTGAGFVTGAELRVDGGITTCP